MFWSIVQAILDKAATALKHSVEDFHLFVDRMDTWLANNHPKAMKLFQAFDVEGSGKLTYPEFKAGNYHNINFQVLTSKCFQICIYLMFIYCDLPLIGKYISPLIFQVNLMLCTEHVLCCFVANIQFLHQFRLRRCNSIDPAHGAFESRLFSEENLGTSKLSATLAPVLPCCCRAGSGGPPLQQSLLVATSCQVTTNIAQLGNGALPRVLAK